MSTSSGVFSFTRSRVAFLFLLALVITVLFFWVIKGFVLALVLSLLLVFIPLLLFIGTLASKAGAFVTQGFAAASGTAAALLTLFVMLVAMFSFLIDVAPWARQAALGKRSER